MNRDLILVVDDIEINRLILDNILNSHFDVVQAENGREAVDYLFSDAPKPVLVLLDIIMPEMDGFQVLEKMQADPRIQRIPVLFITAADSPASETKGLAMGAVDYIPKPFRPEVVERRVLNHVKLYKYSESLEEMVDQKVAELVRTKDKLLETMANIIEYRNLESGEHVKRTRELTEIMLDYLALHPMEDDEYQDLMADRDLVLKAVPLHDIGKIGIPDNVLLKPGRVTPEEFEIIKTHTTIGSEIVETMLDFEDEKYLRYCHDISRYHHERWDGKGYPDGLSGADIPLVARIVSIVDVYDALVSERVYKPAMTRAQAEAILLDGAGKQFDPYLIEVFQAVADQFAEKYQ